MQYSEVKKTKGETENQAYNVYKSTFKKKPKTSMVLANENHQNGAKETEVKF